MAQNDEFIREVDEEYRRDRIAQIWTTLQRRHHRPRHPRSSPPLAAGASGSTGRTTQRRGRPRALPGGSRSLPPRARARRRRRPLPPSRRRLRRATPCWPASGSLPSSARGSAEEGAKAYDALAADAGVDPMWRDLARLRAAMLRMDGARPGRDRARRSSRSRRRPALAPHGAGTPRPVRPQGRRHGLRRPVVRPDRGGPRDAGLALRQRLETYTALVAGGPVQVTQ